MIYCLFHNFTSYASTFITQMLVCKTLVYRPHIMKELARYKVYSSYKSIDGRENKKPR